MNERCYLVATIDVATMQVTHVGTYSAPAWLLTKMSRQYVLANLLECDGASYQEALNSIRLAYVTWLPEMAARFPLKQPDATPRTVEVKP